MDLTFLIGGEPLNEHSLAWRSKDWDAVKKLADSYKESSANEFFATLKQINVTKQRLNVDFIESYSPYAINNELAKHLDCIQHCYVMNLLGDNISDQMHYDYLLHSIRSGNRYSEKTKSDPIDEIVESTFCKAVARYYNVSMKRAKEYVAEHFSEEQTAYMKKLLHNTVDSALVKDAFPSAKKGEIDKVLRVVKDWNKL